MLIMTSIIAKLLKASLNKSVSQFFERRNAFWGIARYNLIQNELPDFCRTLLLKVNL
jgi:hypothetical protein